MKKVLDKTIVEMQKIQKYLDCKTGFDSEDVKNTLLESHQRLLNLLTNLEKTNFKNTEEINKILVHMKLEYSNFVWCFEEVRDHIKDLLINFPD